MLSKDERQRLTDAIDNISAVFRNHLKDVSGQAIIVEVRILHDIATFEKLLDAA